MCSNARRPVKRSRSRRCERGSCTTLHARRLHPIIRALLKDDYEGALERLRPLPEFASSLGPLMSEHIARMQSLGYRYEVKARDLRRFDRFLQQRPELADEPLPVLLAAWRNGARMDAWDEMFNAGIWNRAFAEAGFDPVEEFALRRRDVDELLPWSMIDVGIRREFLLEERRRSLAGEWTPDCRTAGCLGCGICASEGL